MERKKIINILLSFSAVTNINSWRVKSAFSNVVLFQTTSTRTYPIGPFTILEPRDQEIGVLFVIQERRATDFKAS